MIMRFSSGYVVKLVAGASIIFPLILVLLLKSIPVQYLSPSEVMAVIVPWPLERGVTLIRLHPQPPVMSQHTVICHQLWPPSGHTLISLSEYRPKLKCPLLIRQLRGQQTSAEVQFSVTTITSWWDVLGGIFSHPPVPENVPKTERCASLNRSVVCFPKIGAFSEGKQGNIWDKMRFKKILRALRNETANLRKRAV